jgi:O-antigen ligase
MNPLIRFLSDRRKVFGLFCTGILYSLYIWPLLNSILCISLGVYWLLFCKKNFNPGKTSLRLVLIFTSLYLPYVVGMFYTANQTEGYFRLSEHLAFILFPIVFGFSRFLNKDMVRNLLTHFILACLLSSLAGYLLGMLPPHIVLPEILRNGNQYILGDSYPYIIGLGCLLSILIIGETLYNRVILRRGPVLFIFLFLSFYLLFLNVRLLSFCWFAAMLYFIFRRIPSTGYRILLSSAILFMLVTGLFKNPMMKSKWNELLNYREQAIPLDRDGSLGKSWGGTSIRIALWKCGKDLIVRHPFLGVGTGDVQDSLQQAYEDRKFYFASRYNHYNLHNQYLQTLAGFGIFGLLILLACILAPAILLRSGKLSRIRLLFLTIFFLICFTEVILDTNKGIVWYSFFNSIFAFGEGEADL